MNLVAYDNIESVVNKDRTWINTENKYLYSKELVCKKYVCYCKKYNADEEANSYFIIMLDSPPTDRPVFKSILTNNGYIKLNISVIWKELNLTNAKSKYINVVLSHIDHADDGDVYKILPCL